MKTADKGRVGENGGMYFGPKKEECSLSDEINRLIDQALEEEAETSPPRAKGPRLGPSAVGSDCIRRIAYDWHSTRRSFFSYRDDPEHWRGDKKFPGALLRRFALGNWYEDEAARWLRAAGFKLDTHTTGKDGKKWQHSFWVCKDESTGVTRFGGFTDGIIRRGPLTGIDYPTIWENKIMNVKKWSECRDKGVRKSHPHYNKQIQLYMAYSPIIFREQVNSCLFTAINTDTSEICAEIVHFDEKVAQETSDTVVKVLNSEHPEEFPRICDNPDRFPCGWCDHRVACHQLETDKPEWMKNGA